MVISERSFWADRLPHFVENLSTYHVWVRSIGARAFIAAMALAGAVCFVIASSHWHSSDPVKFVCYLIAALLASSLKVSLARHRRNALGELPVHPAGNSRTEPARDAADRTGQHAGAVLLEADAPAEAGPTGLQRVAGDGLQRGRVRRVQAGRDLCSARARAARSAGGGDHALRMQHGGHVDHHRADRR